MLNKDILRNIQTLLAITSSINETYAKLKELEINGQKESAEYNSTIESLKSSLELEKSIYDRFPNDIDTLNKIEYTISKSESFWINFNLKENLKAIINHNNLTNLRIQLKLFNKMLAIKNAEFIIDVSDENILNKQSSRNILLINATIIKDFLNTLLTILNFYLNDEKYYIINDLLLNLKYGISFLYEEIEVDFLENDFNINNILYWQANALADYYRLDREKLKAIQRGVVINFYEEKIDSIIRISLDSESDKQEIFDYTISEILIRASLLLLGEKTVNYLKTLELQLTPDVPHDEKAIENLKHAQDRVNNVLGMYDKDKELLNVISLRMI